jgi:hypothetical protein
MDWKLLVIGGILTVLGGFLSFRFRGSKTDPKHGSPVLMSLGLLLLMTGLLSVLLSFFITI